MIFEEFHKLSDEEKDKVLITLTQKERDNMLEEYYLRDPEKRARAERIFNSINQEYRLTGKPVVRTVLDDETGLTRQVALTPPNDTLN